MRRPSDTIRLLIGLILLMISVCIRHYAEPYDLRNYPISSLGGTQTMNGYPNAASAVRFIGGMIAGSTISLHYGSAYYVAELPAAGAVRALSRLASAGFLFTALPHNIPTLWRLHGIAAGALFVGFWAIAGLQLRQLVDRFGPLLYGALLTLLTLPLVSYALLIVLQSPHENAAQKLVVLSLVLTTLWVSREIEVEPAPAVAGSVECAQWPV